MKPVLAIDFGGTVIKAGLVARGTVLAKRTCAAEAERGLRARLPVARDLLLELCREGGVAVGDCAGVGLIFPCIVDARKGRVISAAKNKFEDAPGIDLPAWAHQELGLPLRAENDAHAALLGEWQHGAGVGCDNLVMLTLGTGIGCSVIVEGHPLRGRNFQTGLLGGHIVVQPDGRPCCHEGGRGCVEAETGSWALPAIARAQPEFAKSALAREPEVNYQGVFRLAAMGDAVSRALRDRSLDLWAATVISLVHLFDPERVILGGGVAHSADVIVPWIQEKVNERAWASWGKPQITRARYLEEAALLGASVLVEKEIAFL